MNKIKIGVATILAVGATAACSPVTALLPGHHAQTPTAKPTPAKPKTFVLDGVIEVNDFDVQDAGCDTTDTGYDDISEGAQVTIKNQFGTVLDVTQLMGGQVSDGVCSWPFTLGEVPEGAKFYSIHVGNENRGDVTYTRSELDEPVTLTLGS